MCWFCAVRVICRIGQTAHLIPVDNDSLCNLFVYPEVDYRPVSIPFPSKLPASPQADLSRPSAASLPTSRSSSVPIQTIIRRQASDSKRPRLGESELEVSHWNGDTFVCAHSRSEAYDVDLAVHQADLRLIRSLIFYMKRKGFLCVSEIKKRFPEYESAMIKLANLLCSLQSIQFYESPSSPNEGGVYVLKKEDGETLLLKILSKDFCNKETNEMETVKRRLDVLEQMTHL